MHNIPRNPYHPFGGDAMKFLAVAMVLLIASSLPAGAQQAGSFQDRPKIIVSGEAVVEATPNKIVVTFGIETRDRDITVAKRKNDEIVKKALAAVKACGVPEKEIQTDQSSLRSIMPSSWGGKEYLVTNRLQVILGGTRNVEEVVVCMLQAGAIQLYGIEFQTSEFERYREQARESALKAAKEKAEKMAAVLGQSVGEPLEISEGWCGTSRGYASATRLSGSSLVSRIASDDPFATDASDSDSSGTSTIAFGKLAIRAHVSVVFALKK
jgi:uncharacterized protein YggE